MANDLAALLNEKSCVSKSFLLNTRDAAAYLGLSPKTLERWRSEGGGPAYVKTGPGRRAAVRYRQADLDAWLVDNTFTSTSAHMAKAEGV